MRRWRVLLDGRGGTGVHATPRGKLRGVVGTVRTSRPQTCAGVATAVVTRTFFCALRGERIFTRETRWPRGLLAIPEKLTATRVPPPMTTRAVAATLRAPAAAEDELQTFPSYSTELQQAAVETLTQLTGRDSSSCPRRCDEPVGLALPRELDPVYYMHALLADDSATLGVPSRQTFLPFAMVEPGTIYIISRPSWAKASRKEQVVDSKKEDRAPRGWNRQGPAKELRVVPELAANKKKLVLEKRAQQPSKKGGAFDPSLIKRLDIWCVDEVPTAHTTHDAWMCPRVRARTRDHRTYNSWCLVCPRACRTTTHAPRHWCAKSHRRNASFTTSKMMRQWHPRCWRCCAKP